MQQLGGAAWPLKEPTTRGRRAGGRHTIPHWSGRCCGASFICLLSKEFLADNARCATNYARPKNIPPEEGISCGKRKTERYEYFHKYARQQQISYFLEGKRWHCFRSSLGKKGLWVPSLCKDTGLQCDYILIDGVGTHYYLDQYWNIFEQFVLSHGLSRYLSKAWQDTYTLGRDNVIFRRFSI